MRTWKDVLSRKEERDNLRNFLYSFVVVFVLVLGVFGAHLMKALLQPTPQSQETVAISEDVELDGYHAGEAH